MAAQFWRFVDNMKECFKEAGIKEEAEMKRLFPKYAGIDEEQEWKSLATYARADATLDQWIDEIIQGYPAADEYRRGSLANLAFICRTYKNAGNNDQRFLTAFQRKFKIEADKLLQKPAIVSNRELVTMFIEALDPECAQRLWNTLELGSSLKKTLKKATVAAAAADPPVADPNTRRREDQYTLDEVMEALLEMASGQYMIQRSGPYGIPEYSVGAKTEAATAEANIIPLAVKKELEAFNNSMVGFTDKFTTLEKRQKSDHDELKRMLSQFTASTPTLRQTPQDVGSYNRPAPGDCFYCNLPGHFVNNCPMKADDLKNHRIIMRDGQVRLPDGSRVPGPQTDSLRTKIDAWHSANPAQSLFNTEYEQLTGNPAGSSNQTVYSLYVSGQRDHRDDMIESLRRIGNSPDTQAQLLHSTAVPASRLPTAVLASSAPPIPPTPVISTGLEHKLETLVSQMALLTTHLTKTHEEGDSRAGF